MDQDKISTQDLGLAGGMEFGGSPPSPLLPLSVYYRVANQIIKQVKVYREEGDADDLCQALTRYIRLMTEFIPQHQDYSTYSSQEKLNYEKILQDFFREHEMVKSVLAKGDDSNSRQVKVGGKLGTDDPSIDPENGGCMPMVTSDTRTSCSPLGTPFSVMAEKDCHCKVHAVKHFYPLPVISCVETAPLVGNVSHLVASDSRNGQVKSLSMEHSTSQTIHDVHISVGLMDEFMELARDNTDKDLETCGVLGAFLKNRTFYVTTLIVPKQESTSSSVKLECQALNEEEIFAVQDEMSLFPVGWIHTHPSQSCFMSSIDLHTQYSYQVMLPEAVAIVMAPKDASKSYGVFRLTDPGGTAILKQCQESGFHLHQEPSDGTPMYEDCSNVYINPNLRFEVIDLRCWA